MSFVYGRRKRGWMQSGFGRRRPYYGSSKKRSTRRLVMSSQSMSTVSYTETLVNLGPTAPAAPLERVPAFLAADANSGRNVGTVIGRYKFKATQFNGFNVRKNLFREFRIRNIVYKVRHRSGGMLDDVTDELKPINMFFLKDGSGDLVLDNAIIPAKITSVGPGQAVISPGSLTHKTIRQAKGGFRTALVTEGGGGANVSGGQVSYGQWLNTSAGATDHYGLVLYLTDLSNIASAADAVGLPITQFVCVDITVTIEYRGAKYQA